MRRHVMVFGPECTEIVGHEFLLSLLQEMSQSTMVAPPVYRDGNNFGIGMFCDIHHEGIDRYLDQIGDNGHSFRIDVRPEPAANPAT